MSVEDLRRITQGINRRITLFSGTLGAAAANVLGTVFVLDGVKSVGLEAKFVRAGGGTTCKAWVQTSLDDGITWFDIASFAFTTTTANKISAVRVDPATPLTAGTTPASATLADNTVLDGILGNKFRVLVTTVGDYTGASSLEIHAAFLG